MANEIDFHYQIIELIDFDNQFQYYTFIPLHKYQMQAIWFNT